MTDQEIFEMMRGNTASYEFEPENYEIDNLVQKTGISRGQAAQLLRSAKISALKQDIGRPMPSNLTTMTAKAQYSLNVKRLSRSLAVSLPVPLFGQVDAKSGYAAILGQFLPPGITVSNVQIGIVAGKTNEQRALITYTDGTDTDTVEVTSPTSPYPSFLEATASDVFVNSLTRYTVVNSSNQSQFSERFVVVAKSLFGAASQNDLQPNAYKNPNQNQSNIVDITNGYSIDKNTTLIVGMNDQAVNNAIILDFFVQSFARTTAKNELLK